MFENEKIVETKICKHCSISFDITDKDLEFYEKVSPSFLGIKYNIPSPKLCPDCRQQRRLSFRNERKLYKRKCDATGKNIISIYSPDKSYKVYGQDFWWSDKWDSIDFGIDLDFKKTLIEQFQELFYRVPQNGLLNNSSINSEFCNHVDHISDCFLIFGSAETASSYYSNRISKSSNIVDCSFISNSENIYSSINLDGCFNVKYCENTKNCSESSYLKNSNGCHHCFGCYNLINKSYCVFNKQYSIDDYFKKIENIEFEIKKEGINKNLEISDSENITGDQIFNSKNIKEGFEIHDSENISFSQDLFNNIKSSYDCYSGYGPADRCYEAYSFGVGAYNSCFISDCYPVKKAIYCISCFDCSNIFGCIGLRNKSYCILNKQYTKEEYEIFIPKIIEKMIGDGDWGEFFPSTLSPFGYNETVACEYFHMKRNEIVYTNGNINNEIIDSKIKSLGLDCYIKDSETSSEGQLFKSTIKDSETSSEGQLLKGEFFNWSDYESPFPKVEKIIPANMLPDDIKSIPDDILNWAIECEVTKKPFKIIAQELEFYRKHNLPIPKRHPDQRHLDRMALRNPRKLYDRNCDKCGIIMKTTYSPDRSEIVYCEDCYNKEVY